MGPERIDCAPQESVNLRRGARRASLLRPPRSTPVDEGDSSNDAIGIVLTLRCLALCPSETSSGGTLRAIRPLHLYNSYRFQEPEPPLIYGFLAVINSFTLITVLSRSSSLRVYLSFIQSRAPVPL